MKYFLLSAILINLAACGFRSPEHFASSVNIASLCTQYVYQDANDPYTVAAIAELKKRGIDPKDCLQGDDLRFAKYLNGRRQNYILSDYGY